MANGSHASCRLPCPWRQTLSWMVTLSHAGSESHSINIVSQTTQLAQSWPSPRNLFIISHLSPSYWMGKLRPGRGRLAQDLTANRWQRTHFSFQVKRCMILHVLLHGKCLEQCLVHTKYWINIVIRGKVKYPNSKV